jgi:flagellar motor switch protein FliG
MKAKEALVKLLHTLPPIQAHNTLMTISDRELALCLQDMNEAEAYRLLSLISPAKKKRVEEEVHLQKRLDISAIQFEKARERVISILASLGRGKEFKSYLRPKGKQRL